MARYRLISEHGHLLRDDGWSIPTDPANADYQEYLSWVAQGGVPDPFVPPVYAAPPDDSVLVDAFNEAISAANPNAVAKGMAKVILAIRPDLTSHPSVNAALKAKGVIP